MEQEQRKSPAWLVTLSIDLVCELTNTEMLSWYNDCKDGWENTGSFWARCFLPQGCSVLGTIDAVSLPATLSAVRGVGEPGAGDRCPECGAEN